MNHFYIGASIKFASPVNASALKTPVTNAWTRLRYWAPVVGTRTIPKEGAHNVYLITYAPPASAAEASQWAAETIKWDETEAPLTARDDAIKEVWWTPSQNHYSAEMHVGPAGDGLWSFM